MILLFLQSIYFMLPAYAANMAPVLFKKVFASLAIPIDNGKKLNKKQILGKNKTWRGLITGTFLGIVIACLQYLFPVASLQTVDYTSWFLIGFLLGCGALVGDLAGSFIKRQLSIPSGKPCIPLDQLDFVFGALLFAFPFLPSIKIVVTIIILTFFLHILVNHIAYYLKIRNEAW